MIELSRIRNLIIDMDGVLWHGERAMPNMPEFFDTLRALDIRFVLATNNAAKSGADFSAKLAGMGAQVHTDEILTSSQATAHYLAHRAPHARVFVIGEDGLKTELRARGLVVVAQDDWISADHVVVGIDRTLTYTKLADACLLIRAGAAFVATNPDVTFPGERGIVPGNGAIVQALRVSTGIEPIVIGKPQPDMMVQALERLGGTAGDTAAIGDRLDTDILGAQRAGLTTLLVLSGVSSRAEAEAGPITPDYMFEDITAIGAALRATR